MLFIEFCHQIDPIDSIGGALVGLMPTFIISPSWGMFCGQTEEKIILGYLPPRYSRYVPIYPHVIPAQSLPSSCHKSKKLPTYHYHHENLGCTIRQHRRLVPHVNQSTSIGPRPTDRTPITPTIDPACRTAIRISGLGRTPPFPHVA